MNIVQAALLFFLLKNNSNVTMFLYIALFTISTLCGRNCIELFFHVYKFIDGHPSSIMHVNNCGWLWWKFYKVPAPKTLSRSKKKSNLTCKFTNYNQPVSRSWHNILIGINFHHHSLWEMKSSKTNCFCSIIEGSCMLWSWISTQSDRKPVCKSISRQPPGSAVPIKSVKLN